MAKLEPIGGDKNKKSVTEVFNPTNLDKKKITRSLLNNTGIIASVFIVFVVIVAFSTDIQLSSLMEWGELGLSFFILMFCSYSMYINCSDSGSKAGLNSAKYQDVIGKYTDIKEIIIESKCQGRLTEFCKYYIEEELTSARSAILAEVGIEYSEYKEKYIGQDIQVLKGLPELSKTQVKAIQATNAIKPVRLTPEMIFKRGRGATRRQPLATSPSKKKKINFVVKFIKTCLTSVLTSVIVLEVVVEPSWAAFAECCLKLLPAVLNGFLGYISGYEMIVKDTVDYVSDQTDLMQQFMQYVDKTPVPEVLINEPITAAVSSAESVAVDKMCINC